MNCDQVIHLFFLELRTVVVLGWALGGGGGESILQAVTSMVYTQSPQTHVTFTKLMLHLHSDSTFSLFSIHVFFIMVSNYERKPTIIHLGIS